MRTLVLCAGLAAWLLPSNAGAQPLPLTEAEALARLAPDTPRARAARSVVDIARADVLAAGRWPNPRVTFDRESAADVTEDITTVAQSLPVSGRLRLQTSAALALVDASSNRADDELRRLRADLRLAFAQLFAAQTREQELTRSRDRIRQLADLLGKREAAGEAAGFDRLRAEREVVDLEADRATAASDRAQAQAALAAFFAGPIDPFRIVAIGPAATPARLPAIEALIERAESVRGELLALEHEIDAARFAERAAARRRIPDPEIVGGTKSSSAAGGDVGGVVMLQATIPLFDRAHAERSQAQARANHARARADALKATLRAQILALHAALVQRRDAAAQYRSRAVASGAEIERIAQVSYDAGERGILELLDALRMGANARVRQTVLDAAVRQAEIELEFVSGWEIP